MKTITIDKASEFEGEKVKIRGWVYNSRSSGSLYFVEVRDGSGFIQAIVNKKDVEGKTWDEGEKITQESSVELTGAISKHPKKDEYELQVSGLEIVQLAGEYPIANKEHGQDFLLDNRHLWLRSPKQWAIQRVRNAIINAIYEFLNKEGSIKIDSPILTPNACEGTTTLFEMDYFDLGKGYLAQSGQLYIEAAIFSHGKVFDFGPVFRAEKSKTRRHLTEFWMMDAEAAFVDFVGNMDIQEGLIKHVVAYVLNHNQKELQILECNITPLQTVVEKPFVRMTHAEAVEKLHTLGSDIVSDDDLGADDETILTKQFDVPIFVMKYPAKVKAFYMKPDPDDASRVLCADLLAPEGYGEIIGGSERISDYDLLLAKMKENNLPIEPFQWYLDLRKYGSVPHSGFGYGLERLTAWITGIQHIRETIPFPRMINRLNP